MLLPSNCVVYVVYLFKISFLNFQKWSSEANFVSDQNLDDAVNVIVLPFLIDSFIMLFRWHNQGFFNDFHNAWVNKFLIISPMLTWIM